MIIQLRGTSGSGKTTAMRSILDSLFWDAQFVIDGRRKPSYYRSNGNSEVSTQVAILGHYESTCGGCDTFKNYSVLKEVITDASKESKLILMEGLMVSDDVLQTVEIHRSIFPIHRIYYLNTPIDVCIERVKGRRKAKGWDTAFNEKKLKNRHAQIERTRPRLEAAGITCRTCSADQAVKYMKDCIRRFVE